MEGHFHLRSIDSICLFDLGEVIPDHEHDALWNMSPAWTAINNIAIMNIPWPPTGKTSIEMRCWSKGGVVTKGGGGVVRRDHIYTTIGAVNHRRHGFGLRPVDHRFSHVYAMVIIGWPPKGCIKSTLVTSSVSRGCPSTSTMGPGRIVHTIRRSQCKDTMLPYYAGDGRARDAEKTGGPRHVVSTMGTRRTTKPTNLVVIIIIIINNPAGAADLYRTSFWASLPRPFIPRQVRRAYLEGRRRALPSSRSPPPRRSRTTPPGGRFPDRRSAVTTTTNNNNKQQQTINNNNHPPPPHATTELLLAKISRILDLPKIRSSE
jgi:hypothetical protein